MDATSAGVGMKSAGGPFGHGLLDWGISTVADAAHEAKITLNDSLGPPDLPRLVEDKGSSFQKTQNPQASGTFLGVGPVRLLVSQFLCFL